MGLIIDYLQVCPLTPLHLLARGLWAGGTEYGVTFLLTSREGLCQV